MSKGKPTQEKTPVVAIYGLVHGKRFCLKLKNGGTREQCASESLSRGKFISKCKALGIPVFDAGRMAIQQMHDLRKETLDNYKDFRL